MKKRLKGLLALCMAGIMIFAMTTGFAAADDTSSATPPAKAEYTGIESVNKDPNKVFYPGDIIASDTAGTGNNPSSASGITFYVAKRVPVADAGIPTEDWAHFTATYNKQPSDYPGGIYKCWNGIDWKEYAVLLAWYSDGSLQYWFEVDKKLSDKANTVLTKYALNSYEYSTNAFHYNSTGIAVKDKDTNITASFPFHWLSYNINTPLYYQDDGVRTTGLRYGLRLPAANTLFGDKYSEYGYHYKLRALDKSPWLNSKNYNYDGMPTGIVQVKNYGGGSISDCLADTIFTCMQDDKYVNSEGKMEAGTTDAQVRLMLEIEQAVPNTYTVDFDSNGGEGTMDSYTQEYTNTDKDNLPANEFTKTGYSFGGWKIKACTDDSDKAINTSSEPYKNMYADKDRYTPSRNNETVTLEAQWTANDYTVKFDTNGGSDIDDKIVKWEDNVLEGVADPTKDGFTFKGWKYGETEVSAETTYSELAADKTVAELTLTAQWEKVLVPVDEPAEPDDTSSTGDNMNITLVMALMLLSCCGIAGAGLYRRKHAK